MPIPDFQTLMLPVLRVAQSGEVKISDVVETLAEECHLTPDERAELLPSGKQTTFANRVHWAKSYLGKADKRIVLVDGDQLTRLMIQHGVGCRVEETMYIKKIDEDFFE